MNDLKQIIREIVENEVPKYVNKAVISILYEAVKNQKCDRKANIQKPSSNSNPSNNNINRHSIKKKYTNNEVLNDILNETVSDLPKTEPLVSIDESISHKKENQPNSMPVNNRLDFLKSIITESSVPEQTSVMDNINSIPPDLKKVFNRDFRSVMKAIDEKKKTGINPTRLIS